MALWLRPDETGKASRVCGPLPIALLKRKRINVFRLFRRSPNRDVIDRLHGEVMALARQPAFFAEYGVADTVEGRFEVLALVGALVVRRIEAMPDPGRDLAQDLTDSFFTHFDVALREIGVGDLTVPKKIKKMAQGWLGRGVAYREGLDQTDDAMLALGLARNVYGDETRAGEPQILRLARYARSLDAAFDGMDVPTLLRDGVPRVKAESV